MSGKVQKTSKLPRSKKTSESREGDHSYTKTTRQSQKGKYKPSEENESSSDESVSLIDESAPCHAAVTIVEERVRKKKNQ